MAANITRPKLKLCVTRAIIQILYNAMIIKYILLKPTVNSYGYFENGEGIT
jgi:hypothetical protein